ncbi:MAG TPA: hypothetical protein VE422_28250 [Terriglobia bacterium]|nr:hypothetical protein [Terriglobia bacterium]
MAVAVFAIVTGLDRERAFYPTVLIVIASYYVLFSVMGASRQTLIIESAVAGAFLVFAVLGFKRNLWLVAGALIGHGVFDSIHGLFIENPGVPIWWPGFCLVFDAILGGLLAVRLKKRGLKPATTFRPNVDPEPQRGSRTER